MRNILVHEYLEIDPRQVWRALGRLDDLRTFADASRRRCLMSVRGPPQRSARYARTARRPPR
ncbi:MAG: DUF86 domain-containing protein [Actinomycetota bacterium]|nr:DUF86 domain-containing protein [Actinomycetota bacterium]